MMFDSLDGVTCRETGRRSWFKASNGGCIGCSAGQVSGVICTASLIFQPCGVYTSYTWPRRKPVSEAVTCMTSDELSLIAPCSGIVEPNWWIWLPRLLSMPLNTRPRSFSGVAIGDVTLTHAE